MFNVPALTRSSELGSAGGGLTGSNARDDWRIEMTTACGATPILATAGVIRSEGRQVELASLPPEVAGMLAGGWLQTPSGARHMIVSESTAGVELLYPVGLAPQTPVELVAGCDHSMPTCAARFDNLANYGGFPFIPTKNPFSTGVF